MRFKKQLKRILALSTAFSIIFSNNAFATPIDLANSTESVATDTLDKSEGTDHFDDEDTNIWENGQITERVDVTVQRESQFEVTIPKDIVLDGETGQADYIINAKGDIAGNQSLKVVPDSEFEMIEAGGKDVITATVTQNDTEYTYLQMENEGTDYEGIIISPLTAGEWIGSFYFNISFELHTHSYNSEITLEPTCTNIGVKTYTCGICNESYDEDIPANGHVEVYAGEVDTHIKCETCDEPLITVHEYNIEVTLDSTCTDTGIKTYTCECGYTYNEEISANGHTYEHVIEPSTCIQNGSEYDKCSVCDNVINNIELDLLEHELELIETTTNGDQRTKKYKCKNCEYANSVTETYLYNFNYTGNVQTVELQPGSYKLETWGAQGGNYNSYQGGKGGYSYGTLELTEKTSLYVYVGGQGGNGNNPGYNGGGNTSTGGHTSGGGGSDIRINSTSLYARVIVAGAGGGAGGGASNLYYGGAGGGATGEKGYVCESYGDPSGGTQTSGGSKSSSNKHASTSGSFGQGGMGFGNSGSGAGGGWYGGGGAVHGTGAGGSGYVYTSSTYSNYPSGCLLNSSYYLTNAQTISGTTSFLSPTGTNETGHSGNGYVRITKLD